VKEKEEKEEEEELIGLSRNSALRGPQGD